jgi:FAD/FMN-containing dehydrogenase
MREFGSPLLDLCAPKPFVDHQAMFDPSFPEGWWYYFRSCNVAALTDPVIDITAERAQQTTSSLTAFPIFQLGGAISRVGDDETAYHGRRAAHTFNINATTASSDGFAEEREWSRSFWTALSPYHSSVYVNFLMEEGQQRVRDAYGAAKYDRLRLLKQQYDPDNFFRLNQNIAPG